MIDDVELKRARGTRGQVEQSIPVSQYEHMTDYLINQTHDLLKETGLSISLVTVIHAVAHSGHVFGRCHSPFTQSGCQGAGGPLRSRLNNLLKIQ